MPKVYFNRLHFWWVISSEERERDRVDICHKQRLCKIIFTRVKVHFVDVFSVQLKLYDSVFGNIKQSLPISNV